MATQERLTMTPIEKQIVEYLINQAINTDYLISIYDGEGYAIKLSNDPVAVINAMHLTDADRVDIITQSNKYIGYIILVYDNDSYDVIHDYSESLTDFMSPVETFAESLIPQ